jgi:hypothetical protein
MPSSSAPGWPGPPRHRPWPAEDAAGAWLEPLLGAHVPLPSLVVTQVQAFHFAPRDPGPWPVFI